MTEATSVGSEAVQMLAVRAQGADAGVDRLAIERPLEIRVVGADPVITMRTPGHDLELAAGLMLSEGVLHHRTELGALRQGLEDPDVVELEVNSPAARTAAALARSSLSNSACGVCGKAKLDLEPLRTRPPLAVGPTVEAGTLLALPARLRAAQALFAQTGGLHAAALFDAQGRLCAVREDVGRHNAMDKLMGWALLEDRLPLAEHLVLLSGRASFELMQKAIMAGVPMVCAISAPSSYAVELAREFGVTLVGFLRQDRFNVYATPARIAMSTAVPASAD